AYHPSFARPPTAGPPHRQGRQPGTLQGEGLSGQRRRRRREGPMRRIRRTVWATVLAAGLVGCAYSPPLVGNPPLLPAHPNAPTVENPIYVPLGPPSYGTVFEKVLDIVDDYFEIAYSNRYDGRIESFPKIAPGLERFFLPGSPDCEQRTYDWLQTVRHRCF